MPAPLYFLPQQVAQLQSAHEMATAMTVSSKLRGLLLQRELPLSLWGSVAVSCCDSGDETGGLV